MKTTQELSFYGWLKTHPHCSTEETAAAYKRWIDSTEYDDDNYFLQQLIISIITDRDSAVETLHRIRCVYSKDDIVFVAKLLTDEQKAIFRPIFKAAFDLPPPIVEFPAMPVTPPPPILTTENVNCVASMLTIVCQLDEQMKLDAMRGFRQIYHKDLLKQAAAKLGVKEKNIIKELVGKLNEQTNL